MASWQKTRVDVTRRRSPMGLLVAIAVISATFSGTAAADHQKESRPPPKIADLPDPTYHPSLLLVGFEAGTSDETRASLHSDENVRLENRMEWLNLDVVRLPDGIDPMDAARAYRALPHVAYAHPNWQIYVAGTPTDTHFGSQWNLDNRSQPVGTKGPGLLDSDIDAPEGWEAAFDPGPIPNSGGVRVGILDTGIDYDHPDLVGKTRACAAAMEAIGKIEQADPADLSSENSLCNDDNGHGTQVAGIIGARANDQGIAGVAPNAEFAVFKAFDRDGSGWYADFIAGIHWMTRVGEARVINMSVRPYREDIQAGAWVCTDPYIWLYGGDLTVCYEYEWVGVSTYAANQSAMQHTLDLAAEAGASMIAAADPWWGATAMPASHPDVVAVSATDAWDAPTSCALDGSGDVDVSAPGSDILSTSLEGGYQVSSGSSMAAAHASGVAAMILWQVPQRTAEEAKDLIEASTDDLGWLGWDGCYGAGRVNLGKAFGADTPLPWCEASTGTLSLRSIGYPGPMVAVRDGSDLLIERDGIQCRTDLASIDLVLFTGSSPYSDSFTIDLSGGPIGPGATPEADRYSEVEFDLRPGSGYSNEVTLIGTDERDAVRAVGSDLYWNRLDKWYVNPDADADVTIDGGIYDGNYYSIVGGGGNDSLSLTWPDEYQPNWYVLDGGLGNDVLAGGDLVDGGVGNDRVTGGDGSDIVQGGDGNDRVTGGDGGDDLYGGRGNDTLAPTDHWTWAFGGEGSDLLSFDLAPSAMEVDLATGHGEEKEMRWLALTVDLWDIENVAGSPFDDTIAGDESANILRGGDGADVLDGRGGSDWLDYTDSSAGVDVDLAAQTAAGGAASGDLIEGFENVIGSSQSDHIQGSSDANTLQGAGGADSIDGGDGNDIVVGGSDADPALAGGAGIDQISYADSPSGITVDLSLGLASGGFGEGDIVSGFENVTGSPFADSIIGSATRNVLWGGFGVDRIVGGGGSDVVVGGGDADSLDGGAGRDTVSYLGSPLGVTVDLSTNFTSGGFAAGDMIANFENLFGSNSPDALVGSTLANLIRGFGGDDSLDARDGIEGNDRVDGGAGTDRCLVDPGDQAVAC